MECTLDNERIPSLRMKMRSSGRIQEELEKSRINTDAKNARRDVEIAELKAEVVKLRDNNEETNSKLKILFALSVDVLSASSLPCEGFDIETNKYQVKWRWILFP
jgi:hypothetical protein